MHRYMNNCCLKTMVHDTKVVNDLYELNKDTNRYVARYNKQKKCFPVRKIKSPTKLLAAKRLQRIRAKTFAETGICGPNPDDSQEP